MTREEWKPFRGSSALPDQIMLSVKSDPAYALTVRWRTDIAVKEGYALYRKKEVLCGCLFPILHNIGKLAYLTGIIPRGLGI